GLIVLMIGLTLIVRGIGHNQPIAESVSWWHLTDCALPCWGGFVVGTTPESDIEWRMRGLFAPPNANVQLNTWQGRPDSAMIVQRIDNGEVSEQGKVSFLFGKTDLFAVTLVGRSLPRLGDVFNLLGSPTCVYMSSSSANYMFFYYADLQTGQ